MLWPCPGNAVFHPSPVALPIKRGPGAHFLPPCICGAGRYFFPSAWTDEMGLTPQQAHAQGMTILSVAAPRPARRP